MWEYYTLECLLYFLKNVNLSHPAYVKEAAVSTTELIGFKGTTLSPYISMFILIFDQDTISYRVFHGFGQAKFPDSD